MQGYRRGKLEVEDGAYPLEKELDAANTLLEFGFNIKFLKRNNTPYTSSPDILMENEKWDIKTLTTDAKDTITRRLRKGLEQAPNLIFDIRKNTNKQRAKNLLIFEYKKRKRLKRLILITEANTIIDLKK